jgi:hypothetical protein
MKPMLYGFVVLALLVASQSQATAAKPQPKKSTPQVFSALGQFDDGYSLSGAVTIDTTTGQAFCVFEKQT